MPDKWARPRSIGEMENASYDHTYRIMKRVAYGWDSDAETYRPFKVNAAGELLLDRGWAKVTANGATILDNHGTTSSTVSDLQVAHDGNFYTLSEESGETPGMDMEVDFTGVTSFSWVQILARYEQSGIGHGITVMLEITPFDGTTWHRYDFFEDQTANLSNENHSFFVPDDSIYINSGVVKVRFVHEMIGTSTDHDLVIDTCALYK